MSARGRQHARQQANLCHVSIKHRRSPLRDSRAPMLPAHRCGKSGEACRPPQGPAVRTQGRSSRYPGTCAIRAVVPTATSFAGETVDFVLFPEGYINSADAKRSASLTKLASELGAPLLVGAIDEDTRATGRARQVLLRFEPDGSSSLLYTKHSTAKGVAFEKQDWEPSVMLPTFELAGVSAGATICHDHYLGLLPRFLAGCGARLWVNPSYQNVTDIKWSSILRLRAVENRFFALCTLHCDVHGRGTHPFAFAPDGSELSARPAGSDVSMLLSECREAGTIYIIDLDMAAVERPLDWSKLPMAGKPKSARNGHPRKPVHVALRGGQPAVPGCSGWNTVHAGSRVETNHGPVYAEVVPKERILDAAACFRVLDRAKEMGCAPILWNHWERLPTDSERLATLMMGRAIECCAPIVVSDRDGIRELVELSNRAKIPARRTTEASGEAIVDAGNAWGLDNAFKIVSKHLPRDMRARALNRYRRLSWLTQVRHRRKRFRDTIAWRIAAALFRAPAVRGRSGQDRSTSRMDQRSGRRRRSTIPRA